LTFAEAVTGRPSPFQAGINETNLNIPVQCSAQFTNSFRKILNYRQSKRAISLSRDRPRSAFLKIWSGLQITTSSLVKDGSTGYQYQAVSQEWFSKVEAAIDLAEIAFRAALNSGFHEVVANT
jgi:hypothetical protein